MLKALKEFLEKSSLKFFSAIAKKNIKLLRMFQNKSFEGEIY